MDSPPKVSGETLIVHHIPLVHCQVSGGRQGGCGSSLKRTNLFSSSENLGLSRTTSLPERDVLQREALIYSSLIQTSGGSSSTHGVGREKRGGGKGGSTASDDSSFASSNSEDQLITAHTLPRVKPRNRNPLRRNPFLLNTDEDEEDEEDSDILHGYLEDSSFHLHSETNSMLDDALAPFHLHDLGYASEPFLLHCSGRGSSGESLRGAASDLSNHLEDLDILGLNRERRHGSSGSNMSMDCGEHDWVNDEEEDDDHPMRCGQSSKTGSYSSSSSNQHCSCCALSQNFPPQFPETFSEPFSEFQQGYGSDSSCNSSEGVLVNFSAIYNKMNNSIPEKQLQSGPTNFNSSTDHSCTSSVSDLQGNQQDTSGGAFYLDLHTSPTEPPLSHQQPSCFSNTFPLIREPHLSTSSTCSCSVEHQGPLDLDANCNSFHPPHAGSSGDLASCLQSQARLVVATQNYYKLVTCDLSSQSSPSPAGSSVNSCSSEHSKGSPTPTQPSEYFLFRQRGEEVGLKEEDEDGESSQRDEDDEKAKEEEKRKKKGDQQDAGGSEAAPAIIEGQVYINISPPMAQRSIFGVGAPSGSRPRSRSYDRNLDRCPSPQLGSLERMLSCPVRLSESAAQATTPPPPPPRVTSFAEIARSKRRQGSAGGSPLMKAAADPFSSTYSTHSHSSVDFSPILEQRVESISPVVSPVRFTRCYSQGSIEQQLEGAKESQTKAEGALSSSSESPPVIRYSKDQRPTSLPIQPFTFHHQFMSKPPQPKPLLPLLTGYISGMQARSSSGSGSGSGGPVGEESEEAAENGHSYQSSCSTTAPTETLRPSPLGSYSPVRLQGAHSPGTCSTCTPSPKPAHSLSCPLSAGLNSLHTPPTVKQGSGSAPLPPTPPPPSLGVKRGVVPPTLPAVQGQCFHHGSLHNIPALQTDTLSPLGCLDSGKHADRSKGSGTRTQNAHHLSPQALKWREYRRRNPLGVERPSGGHSAGNMELRRAGGPRPARRNVFDFPTAYSGPSLGWPYGQSAKLQQSYSDFLPDYFSLTEKPPEEFCLSPDASTSSSCLSSQSHISVDLMQKRGLVKAVNTAVDLIVAHFGTSRDPDVKAKLGNSWVSPNVGHLILKYLCPALRDLLQDGLKAYVLDLIIGQRRCQPWSVVEASTQLGPSTRVLHSLFSKVSQFSELTSHNMRLNAFIFGLLNMKSLEFWFDHLYTHEDIIAAHYSPWGFLPLSQGPCKPLFEELLLLLQPLSLLPFDLDLLFELHLLQKGQEQIRRKEQLCSAGQSSRSTFQLMRGWSTTVSEMVRDSGTEVKNERPGLRREGTWPGMDRAECWREAVGMDLWKDSPVEGQRVKGVGQEGVDVKERDRRKEKDPGEESRQRGNKQAGWWYQLMQSSQVYIDQSTEGSKFVKAEKRKKSSERRQNQPLPTREGVVEGAESISVGEKGASSNSSSGADSAGSRASRPSWMGSPPESVLNQEKDINVVEDSGSGVLASSQEESPSQGQSLRWGRLFGSTVGSPQRAEGAELRVKTQKTRLPSGWLALDRSILDLVAVTIGAGGGKKAEPPTTATHSQTTATPPSRRATETKQSSSCEVRALCHHIATEPGQLSFNKGDILRVLKKADPDWLLCSLGSTQGLVPIIYVTLNSMEDSHRETGLKQL
ncbi:AP-4 complex accessory subunit RUSC2 isoform X2 [Girardinichthys multiradiatus]|uniref:AP-4 complex accessory subunit RUSC2 isoform X2 n=1 Tax=Girardinichthys multiradiatus TaxID=208333 RepID=UPI001FACF86F|nr:AP-4 complex accessory subunit RUSC2 isoform X2 [Girardinichthys multiradiatus]